MSKSKVYQSPSKRSRRLDIRVLPKLDKYITKRPYAPGAQGNNRRKKLSDYAIQLQEKQRAKFIYGLREKQFRNTYEKAAKSQAVTGEKLLEILELRLDNIVFRSGLAKTRKQARQMVSHGHVRLNSKKVDIPSYITKKGDIISPKKVDGFELVTQEPTSWIDIDKKKVTATITKIPTRADIPLELEEQLIVEFYSR